VKTAELGALAIPTALRVLLVRSNCKQMDRACKICESGESCKECFNGVA
jgi:hypothetical protein